MRGASPIGRLTGVSFSEVATKASVEEELMKRYVLAEIRKKFISGLGKNYPLLGGRLPGFA